MNKRWVFKDLPPQHKVVDLSGQINVNHTISTLLVQRGIENFESAKAFFRPQLSQLHDPFLMKDMDKAVSRIDKAIANQEKILIYGDYDVDGTTAVSLVYGFLSKFYPNINYYLPDRYAEGYGLSKQGIEWADENGVSLIITLDCGIKASDKIALANSKNIDVIVCDHHLPPEVLPNACAILDPKRVDCEYPYKELSGCGVGFKLMQAYCIQNKIDQALLFEFIDLVAVSIAADIVSLTGENRVLAHFGLIKLNTDPIPGIRALLKVSGVNHDLTISGIVFTIGPRINAAGRIEHAKAAVDLLTCTDPEQAQEMASAININNNDRRDVDGNITQEALQMIEGDEVLCMARTTVLYKEDWHKGVIGIVASRCIEKYYRPTIILTESNGKATGSARSIEGFDLYEAIASCADLLEQFGGHTHAAGLTMDIANIDAFKTRFEEIAKKSIPEKISSPPLELDMKINLDSINDKFFGLLHQMEPFGPDNMQPIFYAENLHVMNNWADVLKEQHLKFKVKQEGGTQIFDAIAFGMKDFHEPLCSGQAFMMAFHVDENNFNGRRSLQLRVKDISFC